MAVVRYARLARQDLLDIWLWIANDSGVARADDIVARMEGRGAGLADFPEMGVARPDIAPDARSLVVERWLLHDSSLPVERVSRSNTLVVLDAAAAARLPYQAR